MRFLEGASAAAVTASAVTSNEASIFYVCLGAREEVFFAMSTTGATMPGEATATGGVTIAGMAENRISSSSSNECERSEAMSTVVSELVIVVTCSSYSHK